MVYFFLSLVMSSFESDHFQWTGAFAQAVQKKFGGLDGLTKKVNEAALALQGSGWVWLVCSFSQKLDSGEKNWLIFLGFSIMLVGFLLDRKRPQNIYDRQSRSARRSPRANYWD